MSVGGDPARLAVFLSGSGRTLMNLAGCCEAGTLDAEIVLVAASKECLGAQRARAMGLETRVLSHRPGAGELGKLLRDKGADWVVLAGYLALLPIPAGYEGRVVNIHPALLPKFGGRGMFGMNVHRAVLAAGETETGCTVHLCDDRYDTGPVILQRRCAVEAGDTPETLAARVFELETQAYPDALRRLISRREPAR